MVTFLSYNNNLTVVLKNILMRVTEEDSLQIADSDYTDNALENLMRAAQQKWVFIVLIYHIIVYPS